MAGLPDELQDCTGFDWDAGNSLKNSGKHFVSCDEAEEVFFSRPVLVGSAKTVSGEVRYAVHGKAESGRLLTVVFTLRGTLIRVISARPMSRKERAIYDQH